MPGPSASPRLARYAIVAILVLGAWLRLSGIGAGLPYSVNLDEPHVMDRAFTMVQTGSFDPKGFYDYPTLSMYLQTAVISVRFLAGAQNREWHALSDPNVWSGAFFLWCRIATALMSVLTIFIVYRCALRWGTAAAIVSALLVAVQPQLTHWAHYVLTDTPMTLFVALTMLLAICAAETRRWPWFLLAGAAAGLAAGTKYNGILAVLMPLAALLSLPAGAGIRGRALAAAAIIGGAGAAFLLAAPYTVMNLPAFLNGFGDLLSKYPAPAEAKYGIYANHVRNAFVWPGSRSYLAASPALVVLVCGFFTIAWQLRAKATRAAALAVLAFPLAYVWFVARQGGPSMSFERYQLAIWPALAIWFGVGSVSVRDLVAAPGTSPIRRRVVMGLLLSLLAVPAWHAYIVTRDMGSASARQAGEWIVQNVKPTETVVVESDWIHLPKKFAHWNANGLTGESLEAYRNKGVVYFVVCSCETEKSLGSSNPADHPREVAGYNRIFEATTPVARFPGRITFTILKMK